MSTHSTSHPDYVYLKNSQRMYRPRTQRTALVAVENGLLPPAAFILKSVNVKPIFEEPYDLGEIDRILAKKELDIETILLLMEILGKLINNQDPEVALFAAESINSIEQRYNRRIQTLKDMLENNEAKPELLRELIQNYMDLSRINQSRQVLRNFYLHEAYRLFLKLQNYDRHTYRDLRILTGIFLSLGLPTQAWNLLADSIGKNPARKGPLLMLQLEIAFSTRNSGEIRRIIDQLRGLKLSRKSAMLYRFWARESQTHE